MGRIVNHGEEVKTDRIPARKQFPQNVITCLHLTIVRTGKKQPFLLNFSILLFVLWQNYREWCGRVTFSRGSSAGYTSLPTLSLQNPTELFKIQGCLGTSPM